MVRMRHNADRLAETEGFELRPKLPHFCGSPLFSSLQVHAWVHAANFQASDVARPTRRHHPYSACKTTTQIPASER